MNSDGNVTLPAARDTVTFPSSSGCRMTSSGRAFELRQLIKKKDAVMGETHFAGLGNGGAAEQTDIGDGVMRGAKRTSGDERLFAAEHSGDAVDLRALDRFLERHRWHVVAIRLDNIDLPEPGGRS